MEKGKKRAVVLLSGGMDSATVAAMAMKDGFDIYALSFNYGQRHAVELIFAAKQAVIFARHHKIIKIDPQTFSGSALTDDVEVPKHDRAKELSGVIPITYVPARNAVFLSYALAWAEALRAADVFIGVNALDYSGYPDCRPEFIAAFENMANLATAAGVQNRKLTIHAPLIAMSKAEIVRCGIQLGVDYAKTASCYDPALNGRPCGHCDACLLRKKGFSEAGIADPQSYAGD